MAESNVDATADGGKITFADLGIPQAPQLEQNEVMGAARRLSDISMREKLYIFGMMTAIVALVSLTTYRLTVVDDQSADFAFCLVLIINSLFCTFYIFDGIKRERPSELFLLSGAMTLMVIYLVVNYASGSHGDVKLARMIAACILAVPMVLYGLALAVRYYKEGHLIFKIVGANSQLQSLLTKLYCFQDLLKFDFELQLSLIILMLGSRVSIDTKDIVILSVGIPFSITWFIIGYIAFTRESNILAILFFVLCLPGIAYVGYKMWHLTQYIDSHPGLAAATIACVVIGLVVRVLVLILGAVVFSHFGKGLHTDTTPIIQNA